MHSHNAVTPLEFLTLLTVTLISMTLHQLNSSKHAAIVKFSKRYLYYLFCQILYLLSSISHSLSESDATINLPYKDCREWYQQVKSAGSSHYRHYSKKYICNYVFHIYSPISLYRSVFMIIFFDLWLLIPDAIRNKYNYPYSCTAIPNNILYHCLPPINHAQTDRHSYAIVCQSQINHCTCSG